MRAATDIVALIGEHAALKRQGRRWVGLCPFHGEKTPSFSVNAEEGFYYCFGCQAKGDVISFVRATQHLDFVDAVRWLADRSGITIHEDANAGRDTIRRKILTETMERATDWYHQRLLTGPDAGPARNYLRSRGYDGDVVRRFRLGWAPDDWDALCAALKLDEELAVGSGLGFVNRRGRLQDAFRARSPLPHLRPVRPSGGAGGADPAREQRSGQVQELHRNPDLLQAQDAVRPQLGEEPTSSPRARWWSARGTPTSSASSRSGWSGRWPPVAPPWGTSTSGCFGTSPVGWCWPSTPTGPASRLPAGSTSGSSATRSTWWWPTFRSGPTRASWPAPTPRPSGGRCPAPSPSSSSGWSGSWRRPT